MNLFVPLHYSIYRLLHVSAVASHHQGAYYNILFLRVYPVAHKLYQVRQEEYSVKRNTNYNV
jgi:hypothetical protein